MDQFIHVPTTGRGPVLVLSLSPSVYDTLSIVDRGNSRGHGQRIKTCKVLFFDHSSFNPLMGPDSNQTFSQVTY